MHLIITNQIAEIISVSDKTSFLIGGIAPDAVSPKELSHFFIGDVNNYTRSIDFDGFLNKYSSIKNDQFILGYYTHLIADDIWLKGFYLPWLKNRMESDNSIFNLYHDDFRLLNGKLLEHYGVKRELIEVLNQNGAISDLQEVTIKEINDFIPHVLGDMIYEPGIIDHKLNVFTFEQIIGYIETSITKSIMHLNPLLNRS